MQAAQKRLQGDATIDRDLLQKQCDAQKDAFTAQLKQCDEGLAQAQKLAEETAPPFYKQPWFVAPVTAIVTASAIIFATQLR